MNSTTSGGSSAGALEPPDHDDNSPRMIAAAFATWTIAFIFVVLRLWTRARIVRVLGAADWFICLSLIACLGFCVGLVEETRHGMGKHYLDINIPVDYVPMMEAWWFTLLCYTLTLALTKISICLLYLTIFTFEWARRACYLVLAIVVISNMWATIAVFTACIPLQAFWDRTVIATYCQSEASWWANTGLAVGTDLLIFLLPIPMVLPLKLPRRQKVVVVGIFAVGFFICLVSLIRLAYLIQEQTKPDPDFTYNPTLTYWTALEIHTAIVIACVMTLKPLITKFLPGLLDPRSRVCKSGEVSAASSDPPLTIGSRPSRNVLGLGGVEVAPRRGSWVEGHADADAGRGNGTANDIMLTDIEAQNRPSAPSPAHLTPATSQTVLGEWNERRPSRSLRSLSIYDAASERTEHLSPEVTARSWDRLPS
ncbi:hypothetical protein QBC46DRAFT_377642 [Diplogelasinospora grovesii]|uniref:Rhodopsin domain-containing protein n=1 Tax=Diplogelasinospora grovesii TaxID=303347 RepID=A0AAN6NCQ8_9PEZI|nr:hypothetical protein QBC46DRAFT_377642 [Diplogelasinospora grovesii]